jgi:hypothetical protein
MAAWLLLLLTINIKQLADRPRGSPNPQKAPLIILLSSPGAAVVYVDPWFAGVLAFWFYPGMVCMALGGCAVFCFPPRSGTGRRRLGWMALSMGTIFSGPWLFALAKLLVSPG